MSLIQLSKQLARQLSQQVVTALPVWLNGQTRVPDSLLQQGGAAIQSPVNAPILSAEEIVDLAGELAMLTQKVTSNCKPSEALKQGEQSSRFMGAGLEYEESRPYELGDEIRRINWRLMAKTGKAYTKLFQEERQESWLILVDHRQSMRFGSRVRLKATQAARVAGYFAWLAQKAAVPVVGARLAESLVLTPSFEGRSCYAHLMEAFSEACPPLDENSVAHEPHINDVLLSLHQQIQPGSRLILISDFHDADDKTTEILTALQQRAMVKAVLIQDPVERHLPNVSGLRLQSMTSASITHIDSDAQRQHYQ
ncbi:MAG: DUF58 domain-containing protein, partial [Gammaproteobacteria bacterium]|nr:DUF58 domain-containing protein [Gammaproteobacteria bacterium]